MRPPASNSPQPGLDRDLLLDLDDGITDLAAAPERGPQRLPDEVRGIERNARRPALSVNGPGLSLHTSVSWSSMA
jgi:hypothetical protein